MTSRLLIFDSGLGGLTVLDAIAATRPDADIVYVADDAFFPYGALAETALVGRVLDLMRELVARFAPDLVVIACNTASTLVLAPLRARFPDLPFVGTVPAVKPAALASRSKMISVLATPGTVARDYTAKLVRDFAGDCAVELVGSPDLAGLAERRLRGEPVDEDAVARAFLPCFVERQGRRTDQIVLACTHFPLLADLFQSLAPWAVALVDPAPAIARRVDALLGPSSGLRRDGFWRALFTSGRRPSSALQKALLRRNLEVGPTADARAS